jgi:hypothetical protein
MGQPRQKTAVVMPPGGVTIVPPIQVLVAVLLLQTGNPCRYDAWQIRNGQQPTTGRTRPMATLTQHTNEYGMNTIRINGRNHYLDNIVVIGRATYGGIDLDSEWKVTHRSGDTYTVWGGRGSGTVRSDWRVENPANGRNFKCKSLVECLQTIDNF